MEKWLYIWKSIRTEHRSKEKRVQASQLTHKKQKFYSHSPCLKISLSHVNKGSGKGHLPKSYSKHLLTGEMLHVEILQRGPIGPLLFKISTGSPGH